MVRDSPAAHFSYTNQTPEPTPPTTSFIRLSQRSRSLEHCLPALITPGTRTRQPGIVLMSRAFQHYSNKLILHLLILLCLFLPLETTIKVLAHVFGLFVLLPDWPWCFPTWSPRSAIPISGNLSV